MRSGKLSYKPKDKGVKLRDEGFKSKAQVLKFKALEDAGQMAPGTTEQWLAKTKNLASLPERTKPKKPSKPIKTSSKKYGIDGPIQKGWYR